MADVNSNININFNTTAALAQLRSLQAGLSKFHQSLAEGNLAAANAQKGLNAQLLQSVGATGKFSASQVKVAGSTLAFTSALEKNKLSLREYYRYTMAAATANTRVMGKAFAAEREIINRARRDRVKALQAQYVQMNKSNSGFMDAIRIMPKSLQMASGKFTELGTRIQYAAQRQQFLNQLLKQGSTQLLNFGKNTQWAGRQLMVGLTMPLALFGSAAAKAFKEFDAEVVKFRRVYGNAFTNDAEVNAAVENIKKLSNEYVKYGVSVTKTMEMAATAAAAGFEGAALTTQVQTATKLAVLGQIEQQQALETTISLQTAFGLSTEELANKINFLNAVENQTLLSIEDLTIAIPKAAPVIKQLGGSVEDLAFFLTAMKEGGINASEGANALKSGLASLINPSDKAAKFLGNLGINVRGLVEANKGDIKGIVVGFARALDELDPLNRARAIEQMFGKFQFARLSTLFQNVTKDGSQASRAFQLAGASIEELAILSEREMKKIEDSTGAKFQAALENLKKDIMPLGKAFLEALTPVIKFLSRMLEKFNGLGDGTKKVIAIIVAAVAGLGPVILMTFGLLMNALANGVKLFAMLRGGIAKLNGQTNVMGAGFNYMTQEQIENAASSQQLHQTHSRLIEVFNVEKTSVNALAASYNSLSTQMRTMASQNPALFAGGKAGATRAVSKLPPVRKYKDGILSVPGPKGAGDVVPAMLSPGEAVIPTKTTSKYRGLIGAMFKDKVPGFMAGRLPGGPGKGLPLSPGPKAVRDAQQARYRKINDARQGYSEPHPERKSGPTFVGMPKSSSEATQSRQILDRISNQVRLGEFGSMPPTNFGTMIQSFSGRSFPARGVGGVYRKSNGKIVVVKPTIDAKTALAEVRATQIAREVHGLVSPKQTIRTMMDPTDPTGQRKFIVIESPYDPRIAATTGKFSKSEMVKQLVASTLRGDKDLQRPNLSGNVLSDVGTAGVFDRASGFRDFAKVMPSMEEQAVVNLLGVKGGAKKFFAQETSATAASMTPAQYDTAIKMEIKKSIPRLEKLLKTWDKDLSPEERIVYGNMLQRLKNGATTDWAALQPMHARAGDGVIKAEDGVGSGATPSEIKKQQSLYEIAQQSDESKTQIDKLVKQLEKDTEDTLKELKKTNPAQHKKALALLEKSGVTPKADGSIDFKKSKIYSDFIAKDLTYKDGAFHTAKAIAKGQSPTTSGKSYDRIKDQILYRMGAAPKPGAETFSNKPFTPGRLHEDLTSTTQSGSWRSNIDRKSDLYKALDAAEKAHKARNIANPVNVELNNLRSQMIADGYTVKQVDAMLRTELSHLAKTGEAGLGPEKWKSGFAKFDLRLLNSYVNPGGKAGQPVQNPRLAKILDWDSRNGNVLFNPAQTAELKKALDYMKTGAHPVTESQAKLVQAAANAQVRADEYLTKYQTENSGKRPRGFPDLGSVRQAKAVSTLLKSRLGGGYYQGTPTIYRLSPGSVLAQPGEYLADLENKTAKKISVGNTQSKPMGATPSTRKTSDNLTVKETPTKKVVTKSQVRRLGFSMPGRDKGNPGLTNPTVKQGELALQMRNKGYSQAQIDRALRKFAEKELRIKETQVGAIEKAARVEAGIQAEKANQQKQQVAIQKAQSAEAQKRFAENKRISALNYAQAVNYAAAVKEDQQRELKKQKEKQKTNIKNARIGRQEKVGRFSNGASMALGTVGMGLMMSGNQNAGMAVSGLAALAGMAPMLAGMGPVGIALTAVAAVGGGLWMLDQAAKKAAQSQSRQVDATRATTEKMKTIGAMNGKVGASEIYARKRQESVSDRYSFGFKRGKTQYGADFLKEQVGKDMMAGITKSLTSGSKNTASQVAIELAGYISDGILTAQQANSIADQIGIELGNTTMGADITGKLLQLVGPDGKDLLTNPLEVRVKLIQEQQNLTKDVVNELEKYANENKSSDFIVFEGGGQTTDGKNSEYDAKQVKTFAAAAAASNIQDLEFSQAQIDSLNLEKDKKIDILKAQKAATADKAKQLEIDKKIRDVEKDRVSETKALRAGNKKIMQEQLKAFKAVQTNHIYGSQAEIETSYFEGLKTQVREKYKDDPNQTAFLEKFFEGAKNAGSQEIEVKLNTLVGSGQMSVSTSVKLMEMFAGDEKGLNKVLNLTTSVLDPGKVNEFINQVDALTDPGTKKEIIVALTAMAPKESEKILAAFNLMKELNPELNIEFFFKDGGEAGIGKLQKLADKLELVKNIDIPVKEFLLEAKEIGGVSLDGLNEIMEEYKNQPDFIHKVVLSQFIVLKETLTIDQINAEKKRMLAGYKGNPLGAQKYSEYLNTPEGTEAAKASYMKRGVAQAVENELSAIEAERLAREELERGTKTDPFEWMLAALKNVRNAAIDAKGGLDELRRALAKIGPKSVGDKFLGIDQQMVAQGRNKQFIDYAMGLAPDDQAKLFTTAGPKIKSGKNKGRIEDPYNKGKFLAKTVKQGDVVLSEQGKLYNNFFDAKVIGDFNAAMGRSLSSIQQQEKARIKLVAAGYDSATIEGLLTDEYTTQLIASGKITEEQLKKNVEITKEIANRQKINSLLARGTSELQRQADMSRAADAAKFLRSQGVSEDGVRAALGDAGSLSEAIAAMDQYNSSAGLAAGTLKTIVDGLNAIKANSNIELILKFTTSNLAGQISQGAEAAKKIMDSKRTVYNNLTAAQLKNATSSYVDPSKPAQQVGKIATATVDARYAATKTAIPSIAEGATIKSLQKAMDAKAKEINLSSSNLQAASNARAAVQDQISDAENALQSALDKVNSDVDKEISAVQDVIKGYEKQIKSIEKTIKSREDEIKKRFTDKIEAFNKESQMLSNDLAIMDKAAEDINEKYDKQVEALQQVNELNQQIIDSQGQQLDLADALSKGDIAAAARVAQEMRAAAADSQADTIMQGVELSRTNDLSALTGAQSGLTTDAISDRQFEISQEIYRLETDPARVAIEAEILALNESISGVQELIIVQQEKIDSIEAGRAARLAIEQTRHDLNVAALKTQLTTLTQTEDMHKGVLKKLEAEEAALLAQEGYLTAIAEEAVAIDNTTGMTLEDWESTEDKVKTIEELAAAYAVATQAAAKAVAAASTSWGEILKAINEIPTSVETKLIVDKIENITQSINKVYTDDGSAATAEAAAAAKKATAEKTAKLISDALRKLQSGQALTDEEKKILGMSTTKSDDDNDASALALLKAAKEKEEARAAALRKLTSGQKLNNEERLLLGMAAEAEVAEAYDPTNLAHKGSKETGYQLNPWLRSMSSGAAADILESMGYWADGGVVYRGGGSPGPEFKSKGTDTVPAMLTPGEFVVKNSAVKKYGSKFFKNLNDKKYPKKTALLTPSEVLNMIKGVTPSTSSKSNTASTTPKEVLDIIRNLTPSLDIKPRSAYDANNQPTGSPYGKYWGELERLVQGSPLGFDSKGAPIFNTTGKDPWGGTEPGPKFTGHVADFSDYWHQLAEQPKKPPAGMSVDKTPERYVGSGASMGGMGSGVYSGRGLETFSRGGMVNPLMMHDGGQVGDPPYHSPNFPKGHVHHPDGRTTLNGKGLTRDGNPAGISELFKKENWEQTANFFGLPSMGRTLQDMKTYGGPSPVGMLGMMAARLTGKEMKSSVGDNLITGLNVIPIPIIKLLKPVGKLISKVMPEGLKSSLAKNGIDIFSKLSAKVNPPEATPAPSLVEEYVSPPGQYEFMSSGSKDPWDISIPWDPLPPTRTDKFLSSVASKGRIGLEASDLMHKTIWAAQGFGRGFSRTAGSAWNSADPTDRLTSTLSRKLGSLTAAPFAKPLAKLGKEFNPKALRETDYNEFSYIQKSMFDETKEYAKASYTNMFKNITSDAMAPVKKKLTETKNSIMEPLGKIFANTNFGRNMFHAKLAGDDIALRNHYITQAITDSIPGGPGALIQMARGVHRARAEITDLPSPLERYIKSQTSPQDIPMNAFGPGMYSATDSLMSERVFRQFGDFQYGVHLTPQAILKVLMGKGFIDPKKMDKFVKDYIKKTGTHPQGMSSINANINAPIVQELIKAGYLGYRHGDAFTNWGMGNIPGMSMKIKTMPEVVPRYIDGELENISTANFAKITKPNLNETTPIGNSKSAVATILSAVVGSGSIAGLSLYNALNANADTSVLEDAVSNKFSGKSGGLGSRLAMQAFASGGLARGTDIVPAMLTPGEFVMSKYAVEAHGADAMKAINNGSTVGDSVYNYSINVNVKSDSNPDEIARAVMTQIKSVDSQKIRGVRI